MGLKVDLDSQHYVILSHGIIDERIHHVSLSVTSNNEITSRGEVVEDVGELEGTVTGAESRGVMEGVGHMRRHLRRFRLPLPGLLSPPLAPSPSSARPMMHCFTHKKNKS